MQCLGAFGISGHHKRKKRSKSRTLFEICGLDVSGRGLKVAWWQICRLILRASPAACNGEDGTCTIPLAPGPGLWAYFSPYIIT